MAHKPDVICRSRDLGKVFRFYGDNRGRLREWISLGRQRHHQTITALEGVSFDVSRGSCLGLIGSNGAGKSTLLSLLAGLTPPTSGTMEVRGRSYALIDLGVGFHQEFSGRDNAVFNAELLGIPAADRRKRMNEIIEFAELGSAIDRPLKTYSTGMVLRLGFSVALQVRPDILFVDEVLAVGDVHFSMKCTDAMDRFRDRGGTIIFCSHDLFHVRRICDRVLWLEEGRVRMLGATLPTTEAYEEFARRKENQATQTHLEQVGRQRNWPRLTRIWMTAGDDPEPATTVRTGDDLSIHIDYEATDPDLVFNIGLRVDRHDNMFCFGSSAHHEGHEVPLYRVDGGGHVGHATFRLPKQRLLSGEYSVSVYLADDRSVLAYHQQTDAIRFCVSHDGRDTGLFKADGSWMFAS